MGRHQNSRLRRVRQRLRSACGRKDLQIMHDIRGEYPKWRENSYNSETTKVTKESDSVWIGPRSPPCVRREQTRENWPSTAGPERSWRGGGGRPTSGLPGKPQPSGWTPPTHTHTDDGYQQGACGHTGARVVSSTHGAGTAGHPRREQGRRLGNLDAATIVRT